MTPFSTERTDPATLAAAEGQAALGRGDTTLARAKFMEAGNVLFGDLARTYKHSEKSLLRFLAATQYYKGGDYQRALDLTKKIETRLLPEKTRGLLPQFIKDIEFRAAPDYPTLMGRTLARLWQAGEHRQILDLLKDHPYLYAEGPLAFLRTILCQELGKWRAAAIFYVKTLKSVPDDTKFMILAARHPLILPSQGRLPEAWEYVSYLLELAPNAVTYMVASIVCFFRASQVQGDDRLTLHREQIRYFDAAWLAFRAFPDIRQRDTGMHLVMSICIDPASLALMRLGDTTKARILAEEAIRFQPSSPGPLTVRGMLTYPEEQAVTDFRKAAELPEVGYAPFLYLAHHALHQGRFIEAIAYCQKALERNPARPIQPQIHGWIAVCRDCQGANREEVESLFQQAFEIDPANDQVAANYAIFKETESSTTTPLERWNTQVSTDAIEHDHVKWELEQSDGVDQNDAVNELLLAG